MSGKGASVGASRAGVPGAPRVLVYVADPRQLEPAAVAPEPPPQPPPAAPPPSHLEALYMQDNLHQHATPRNSLYRNQVDCPEQKRAVYYKSDNDGKHGVYEMQDSIAPRPDYMPVSQQFVKDSNIRVEDVKVNNHTNTINPKIGCASAVCTDISAVETFQTRIPLEGGELTTYQRCSGPDSTLPMNSVAPQHNQFSESLILSGDCSNSSERELSRSYVNYQFLEQSVSHQSIVNQSISILNQQVGVSRGLGSEGESGNSPQLVRTAEGVVLAVLPSSKLPQSDGADHSSKAVLSDNPQTVVVPLGWRRIINHSSALYISPSGTALSNLPQLREYLQTSGTCKCGLPCPLRPETAFSFDPKVISKPYQAGSGAELTKLCNHKRKLLASLQARAHSPGTPPPQNVELKKVPTVETVLKKKMKKRPGFPPNMAVSQLMVQRERPLNEFKPQDIEHNRTISPGVGQRPSNGQSCMSSFAPLQQNVLNTVPLDNDVKPEGFVQRSSHYLTVNSGWITQQQQENLDAQKPSHTPTGTPNNQVNVGLPVLGTNGQVIGVNTSFNKQTTSYKNVMGIMPPNAEHEIKEERKDNIIQHSTQSLKKPIKEEESQIFCGLNQPLTPEVMQKINEQQQIFIQQNQKQIEMAMKGFRTQLAENVNHTKTQNQYVPQAQLVIQNGAVVKTNPAKTPPWQVKRNEACVSNPMTSPSNIRTQKLETADYEDTNAITSDDLMHSYNPYSNDHSINQAMCSRVPPLPQHYNMLSQQWPCVDVNKKKTKTNCKGSKKKGNTTENKVVTFGSNGLRIMSDSKNEIPNNNVPSFMEDPNGFLAQQTVLLNNTISRQVGMNTSYDSSQYDISNSCYYVQNQSDKLGKQNHKQQCEAYRGNMVPNPSPSPNNTPDSSVVSDKVLDQNVPQCCKGCNVNQSMKSNVPDNTENHMRLKYMKQNSYKMELDATPLSSSPKHLFEDNPVTSSTYLDRSPLLNDSCGPIQAGTVSTSNVSPTETQPPEPSPTLSNSSRSTDTPHSSGGNNIQMQQNCSYPIPGPVFPNMGLCKENFMSNPPTPGGLVYPYNSPGPPNSQSISGTQMMHFISNHNVNKNLMEVDNISMVGVKPVVKHSHETYRSDMKRRMENAMPGYCPPPHLGGGPAHSLIQTCYVQTFVTTMASGFSVTRDTVTSVLAGKANTVTTSINAAQANFARPPLPPSVNLATSYAIPNNHPDPFLNSVNLPTSYPLHIAGTTAQNMISKSPLEMVQNVIGSMPPKSDSTGSLTTVPQIMRRPGHAPGQILISSTGQIIVSSSHMPPPPPKTSNACSNNAPNVTTSITQAVPAVGVGQPMTNQPTMVVNTLPAPFVLQPPMMAVDGQVVSQNTVLPQIVTGGMVSGQSPGNSPRQIDVKNGPSFMQGITMLSPESLKKRNKKKKNQPTSITNVLQITAPQQNPNSLMVHHTSPQHNSSPQFSPRSFQLSPNNNISPTPMLQALTIMPGKTGTPAHIVMNGQGNGNNFGSQQIITNTSPSQQINLLQPVNLINNASGVMSNFPAFQQFIVPNLGGMVMTTDGTAIIQDNSSGMPMQLQLQTVNGQNVLTPVQNSGVFTTGANGSVVIRAQNQQGKIIQSQHSPGAQFLSPNSQVVMNSPNFNGQLSPLLTNLSPTNVAFNPNAQARPASVHAQEYIQTNQMGQMVVPLSPKRATGPAAGNRGNSTFVQQNTTIVQQQTTLVANTPAVPTRLSIDANVLLAHKHRRFADGQIVAAELRERIERGSGESEAESGECGDFVRHSVSTQTRQSPGAGASVGTVGAVAAGSAPDTTTHSPPAPAAPPAPPAPRSPRRGPHATHAPHAPRPDTTTDSPEPADANSSAMVQCVSSSEQDMAESREHSWTPQRNDFGSDNETQNMMPNVPLRQNRQHNPVESTELLYNHNMNAASVNNQQLMPMGSNYYDRTYSNKQMYKRKNEYGDGTPYRNDKIMRTNYGMVHGVPKDTEYDSMRRTSPDKTHTRQFHPSGTSSQDQPLQKVFDRHNIDSGDDESARRFSVGDVVWGPARGSGLASWPGSLRARAGGRWLVRWFGGLPAGPPVPAARLLTLSEGLEAHHAARTRHRKSRKLNTLLENAIQEAMAELDKKSEGSASLHVEDNEATESEAIVDTPKRSRKHDKAKTEKHKKKPKTAPSISKSGDNTRLRSSR